MTRALALAAVPTACPMPVDAGMLLAEAQIGLFLIQNGHICWANPAADAMLGWPAGMLKGQPALTPVAPCDRAMVAEQVRLRMAGVPGLPYDVQCIRRDGSVFDGRLCGRLIQHAGAPADLITLYDVSEVRRAAREAQWSAGMLAHTESLCRSGSFEMPWPRGELTLSGGLRALLGLSATDAPSTGLDDAPWLAPDDRNLVREAWRRAVPGTAFEFQHRVVCADGSQLVVLQRGMLHRPPSPDMPPRAVAILQDITQQRAAERRIEELANFDELTGLPNRAHFLHELQAALDHARARGRGLGVLAIEVAHIGALKTTLGFAAGDALALELSARLRGCCGEHEVAAHLGESEFALLVPLLDPADLSPLQRLAALVQSSLQAPVLQSDTEMLPLCGIGIAVHPGHGDTPTDLLAAAQKARRGLAGPSGVSFHERGATAQALRELQLTAALRHAIRRDELSLVYQPQLSLHTGQIIGMEALLRWQSPQWGTVSPAEFIPLAERSGLISGIGEWVLRTACRQQRAWREAGLDTPRVAVNFSPVQFQQSDVVAQVRQALAETGLDPGALGIELTETTLMGDVPRATAMLRDLKALGVEISLDDFGTGYSSLSSLRDLPIDVLKVDRSFVHDVTTSPRNVSVTRAIITMAHGLQLRVLAEGVETEEQLGLLGANGCDLIQGYWFSRPLPPDAMTEMLWARRGLPDRFVLNRRGSHTLLLVEDATAPAARLPAALADAGCRILLAGSTADAARWLGEQAVDLVVARQAHRHAPGLEFLQQARRAAPQPRCIACFDSPQVLAESAAAHPRLLQGLHALTTDTAALRACVDETLAQLSLADETCRLNQELARLGAELARTRRQAITSAELESTSR